MKKITESSPISNHSLIRTVSSVKKIVQKMNKLDHKSSNFTRFRFKDDSSQPQNDNGFHISSKREMLERHGDQLFGQSSFQSQSNSTPQSEWNEMHSTYALPYGIEFLSLALPNATETFTIDGDTEGLVPSLVSVSTETSCGGSIATEKTGKTALGKDRVQETVNCSANIHCYLNRDIPQSIQLIENQVPLPINVDFVLESNEEEIALFANDRMHLRHYRDAVDIYETVLYHYKRCYGNDHHLVIDTLSNLCIANTLNGNYVKASSYCQETLELRRKKFGEENVEVASSLSELGIIYYAQEDFGKALSSLRQALSIYTKSIDYPNRSTRICSLLNNIGCVHYSMGKVAMGLSTFEECLGLQRSVMGRLSADILNRVLYNMSITLCNAAIVTSKQGESQKAISLLEEGLMVQHSILPEDHRTILTMTKVKMRLEGEASPSPYNNAIELEFDFDIPEKESEQLNVMIDNKIRILCADMISLGSLRSEPKSDVQVAANMNIHFLMRALEEESKSKRHCSWVDMRNEKNFTGGKNEDFSQVSSLACTYIKRGDLMKAIDIFETARKEGRNKCGDVEYILSAISHSMGLIYLCSGNNHQALACFKDAVRLRSKVLDHDSKDLLESQSKYGLTLIALQEFDNALSKLQSVLHTTRRRFGYHHERVSILLNNIACCHYWLGGHLTAVKTIEEAIEILRETKHKDVEADEVVKVSILIGRCLNNLAFLRSRRHENSEAIVALEEVLVLSKKVYGTEDSIVQDVLNQLSYVMASANNQDSKKTLESITRMYSEMLSI